MSLVGKKVHLGFGAKGGAGFYGIVTKEEGGLVHVKSRDKHHDGITKQMIHKTYKGPKKYVTVQEGLGSALRRATGAKTNLGAAGAALATVGASALAGAAVWPAIPQAGAAISGGFAVASLLNRMRRKRKLAMAEDIQTFYEGFFDIQFGSKPKKKAAAAKATKPAGKTYNTPKYDPKVKFTPEPEEEPEGGRMNPKFWWRNRETGAVHPARIAAMRSFNARQERNKDNAAGIAHHQAWMKHLEAWRKTPQAKGRGKSFTKESLDEGMLGDLKAALAKRKKAAAVHGKLSQDASMKRGKENMYRGAAEKSYNPSELNRRADTFAARASQQERRAKAVKSGKAGSLKYMKVDEGFLRKMSRALNAKKNKEAVYNKNVDQSLKKVGPHYDTLNKAHDVRLKNPKLSKELIAKGREGLAKADPRLRQLARRGAALNDGDSPYASYPNEPRHLKYMGSK